MFRNMTASLVVREIIRTTLPKAKALRSFAEPLISRARRDTVANRRIVFSRLRSPEAVGKLFVDLGPRYQERPGGYLRILRDGFRPGDKAPMAWVELVDRPGYEPFLDEETRREREARRAAARAQAAEERSRQEAAAAEQRSLAARSAQEAAGEKEELPVVPDEAAESAIKPSAEEVLPKSAPSPLEGAPEEAAAEEAAAAKAAPESQKKGLASTLTKPFKTLARLLRKD